MTAGFTYALRYEVRGHCVTPIRTGGTDGDTQTVLRDSIGRPYLQGTSLAGALREWCSDRALFGSQAQESSLIVSDVVFEQTAQQSIRPRVRIDGVTGAASDGGKFDVACLVAGTRFTFTLVWRGKDGLTDAQTAVEGCLSALQGGAVVLGAQRSNGFGRVALDEVKRRRYDMTNAGDRAAWLEDAEDGEVISIAAVQPDNRVVFTVTANTNALLVKGPTGSGVGAGGIDAVMLSENDRPVVPGSSIKGAFRAHMAKIAPLVGISAERLEQLLGRMNKEQDNGIAGQLRFSDGSFTKDKAFKVHRIRLDRFTGGVIRGGLFTEQPVCGLCSFTVSVPADAPDACLLLSYALRDLGCGRFTLGGGAAREHGRMYDLCAAIAAPGGKTAELRCQNGKLSVKDPANLVVGWQQGGGPQ